MSSVFCAGKRNIYIFFFLSPPLQFTIFCVRHFYQILPLFCLLNSVSMQFRCVVAIFPLPCPLPPSSLFNFFLYGLLLSFYARLETTPSYIILSYSRSRTYFCFFHIYYYFLRAFGFISRECVCMCGCGRDEKKKYPMCVYVCRREKNAGQNKSVALSSHVHKHNVPCSESVCQ